MSDVNEETDIHNKSQRPQLENENVQSNSNECQSISIFSIIAIACPMKLLANALYISDIAQEKAILVAGGAKMQKKNQLKIVLLLSGRNTLA